jgi:hypothetical protein
VTQADLSDQELEPVAAGGRSARVALILVDDDDVLAGPTQIQGALTRSYWRAVLPVLSRTWTRVDWRT